RHPPPSPLRPYTALFRSASVHALQDGRDSHLGVEFGNGRADGLGLGAADARHVVRDLALQIGQVHAVVVDDGDAADARRTEEEGDRKSTRLNSSHVKISY